MLPKAMLSVLYLHSGYHDIVLELAGSTESLSARLLRARESLQLLFSKENQDILPPTLKGDFQRLEDRLERAMTRYGGLESTMSELTTSELRECIGWIVDFTQY